MRGKRTSFVTSFGGDRITPADAGKTRQHCAPDRRHGDHPRGCGENGIMRRRACFRMGSPPRMRGKLLSGASRKQLHGITPADAGKTFLFQKARLDDGDHPRGCGENKEAQAIKVLHTGSPPRMRGKRRHSRRFAVMTRITPADAGKTTA